MFLEKHRPSANGGNSSYAEGVLKELAEHHAAIGQAARQLGIDPRTLVPPFLKLTALQAFLREKEPQIASDLRTRFIQVDLPAHGFERTSQGLESRWFILGCGLLLFAVGLVIWGFSLGNLTWDQQRLLVWALPLASGFAAAAFAGSINTQARDWIPGLAITATGGFAVWLVTFFFLFPESKVKELNGKSSTPPAFPQEVSQTKADRDTNGKPELILKCRVEAWPAGYELTIQASDDDKFSQFVADEPIHPDNGKVIGPIALNREPRTATVWYRFVITPLQGPPLFGPVMSLEFPPIKSKKK